MSERPQSWRACALEAKRLGLVVEWRADFKKLGGEGSTMTDDDGWTARTVFHGGRFEATGPDGLTAFVRLLALVLR